jgi:very-short-patch-repair endonuclease
MSESQSKSLIKRWEQARVNGDYEVWVAGIRAANANAERCKKLSESHKRLHADPVKHARFVALRHTEEWHNVQSNAQKKRWAALTEDQKIELMRQSLWKRPPHTTQNTKLEFAVFEALDKMGIRYIKHLRMGRFMPDIYIPKHNLIIECDGTRWHSLPGVQDRDKRRDTYFTGLGMKVIHIPDIAICKLGPSEAVRSAARFLKKSKSKVIYLGAEWDS